jgi:hypothetical protein
LSFYDWFKEEYPTPPADPMRSERIQHRRHHQKAINALHLFYQLPENEKKAVKESLKSNLITIERWLSRLGQSNLQILCMGELHEESTRYFLSQQFFANFSADALLLEATQKESKRLVKKMEAGRTYFPLLDADIMNVLRAIRGRSPDVRIYGIEETEKQAENDQYHRNSRDQSIANNFWATFVPGQRHIILFGALHCTNESNWLFQNLYQQASPALKNEMLNARVIGEHQNGSVEAFVFFLDEIDVINNDFVIPDTHSLPDQIYEWFPLLNRETLAKYRSLIVFRT